MVVGRWPDGRTTDGDPDGVDACLELIPRDVPPAVEFRDPRWYADSVFEMLQLNGAALCLRVYACFNNDAGGHAPTDAACLARLLFPSRPDPGGDARRASQAAHPSG